MKEAFDIPAINNHQEALAVYLEIDSNVDSELSKIEESGVYGTLDNRVHCFRCEGKLYSVANSSKGLSAKECVHFNSGLWSIKPVDPESPYERFNDELVMKTLETISPSGYQAVAINQREHKVLFKNEENMQVVFSFASHYPDDLTSYYLRGRTADNERDIGLLFILR